MPPSSSSSSFPLRIVPKELLFPPPLNRVITNILKLQNVSQNPVAYKVKTTAPQRYCVRPNNGVLTPGEVIDVQVLLNYIKDAPASLDVNDKFQIQSIMLMGPYNPNDVSDVWARASPDQVTKQKLKARFTDASASAANKSHLASSSAGASSSSSSLNTSTLPDPQLAHLSHLANVRSSAAGDSDAAESGTESEMQQSTYYTAPTQPSQEERSKPPELLTPSSPLPPSLASSSSALSSQPLFRSTPIDAAPSSSHQPDSTPLPHSATGDYVTDTIANVSSLRKALEQATALKNDKEAALRENQRLNDQVKTLHDQLQKLKEEQTIQVGLRHRAVPNATPITTLGGSRPDIHDQPMHIQIQTKVFMIVVLFFAVLGFLLGRVSR